MHHLSEGQLLAYHDQQITRQERAEYDAHLSGCDRCRAELEALVDDALVVGDLLSTVQPGPLDQPDAHRVYTRMQSTLINQNNGKGVWSMFENLIANKKARTWVGSIAALAVLVGLLALAPVRALASSFLSIFRVESFVVVDVDPQRMEEIGQAMESLDDDLYFGEQEVVESNEPVEVASLDEAASVSGFAPLAPGAEYGDPTSIMVAGKQHFRFTPEVEALREVFTALDLDPALLPDSMDGQPIDVTLDGGVATTYTGGDTTYAVMQGPSPVVDVPDDVDVQAIGEAMLQVLGLTPAEAAQLADQIDFTTTLVLPVPTNLVTVREVEINGVSGLLFEGLGDLEEESSDAPSRGLLWQKDGYVYSVTATNADSADILAFASTLD